MFYTSCVYAENHDIDSSKFNTYYHKLANDEFEGRGVGSRGCKSAANYLSKSATKIGLTPIGQNGTFFQPVPMHSSLALPESDLTLHFPDTTLRLELFSDYFIFNTARNYLIPKPLDIVFVAYGITAPEYNYDDYAGLDVAGKIVMFIGGEPNDPSSSIFNGQARSVYSYRETKQRIAMSHGAVACIYIPTAEEYSELWWSSIRNSFEFEYTTLSYSAGENLFLFLNPTILDNILSVNGSSIHKLHEQAAKNKLKSMKLKTKLNFKGQYRNRDFLSQNVIGMIKGNDDSLANEYIIISAHYDHLGIGTAIDGDSIYNGALDNAMGCAAIMELSRRLVANKPNRRSIVFVWLTGEESGLLGSRYYCDYPIVPLSKTIANINVDGLAFIDKFRSIIPIGGNYSNIGDIIKNTADSMGIIVEGFPDGFQEDEAFSRSDQVAFANAGIPSVLIMDGVNYENITEEQGLFILQDYLKNVYHTPFDDLNFPVNYNAIEQHIEILYELIINMANTDNIPQWNKDSEYYQRAMQNKTK